MRQAFVTVARAATAEYIEKKSRFIALALPARDAQEAEALIEGARLDRKDASHHAYAYVAAAGGGLSDGVVAKRCSDDGEPSGTAGSPALEAIEKRGLCDVAVVVTRYYGGTPLGASGLTRAYGKAAVEALDAAGEARMEAGDALTVLAPYASYGAIRREMDRIGAKEASAVFGADVEIRAELPKRITEEFLLRLADVTAGAAVVELAGELYIAR